MINSYYSSSLRFGFLEGSLDKNPKMKRETKKITVVYTKIFKVIIKFFPETVLNIINYTKIFQL